MPLNERKTNPFEMGNFLARVERFLAETGMAPARLGKEVLGDFGFVRQLRKGRSPRLNTVEKVDFFMESYRRRMLPAAKHQKRKSKAAKAAKGPSKPRSRRRTPEASAAP